jgi:activator of 2-hydroxyglutaryl-CoA dehydratase
MRRVGVDVGGTFTDLVLFDSDRAMATHVVKILTTLADPSEGFRAGLEELLAHAGLGALDVDLHYAECSINASSARQWPSARAFSYGSNHFSGASSTFCRA